MSELDFKKFTESKKLLLKAIALIEQAEQL
jgi:hypothetical protein